MKRVPTTAPAAPNASAAATPRPSAIAPAASTGTFTASRTCGTSDNVPISPGMAARVRSLRHDPVSAAGDRFLRVMHLAAHHGDFDAMTMHAFTNSSGTANPATKLSIFSSINTGT